MRRTLQGTKWLSRWKSNASVECRTVPCNFGYHYRGIVLTDSAAVWNKEVELTWFCAGYTFAGSFVSEYVCRDHTENKGNMTGRCLVYWCAVTPFIQHTFVLFRTTGLSVWAVGLWQQCLSTLLSLFWTETGNTCEVRSNSVLKIFTGLSTYITSKGV